MSQFLTGSLCLNDILDALKANHSAFYKSEKNGKTYINIKEWINDEPDEYGRHASIQLNSAKDAPEAEQKKRIYLGNLKIMPTGGTAVTSDEAKNMATQFEKEMGNGSTQTQSAGPVQQAATAPVAKAKVDDDELPF